MMKKPKNELEYIEFYAEKMKNDSSIFEQQRKLIESQMRSSSLIFKKTFPKSDFKKAARDYLRKIQLIK